MNVLKKLMVSMLFGMAAVLVVPLAVAGNGSVGIVLMRGKWGSPDRAIDTLASALHGKDILISTPEMPWSRRRSYDRSAEDALNEIDADHMGTPDRAAAEIVKWIESVVTQAQPKN